MNITPITFLPVKFQGNIQIKSDRSLAEVSSTINAALNIKLEKDTSGYYEEFPAYSCTILGIQFALLGIPDRESRLSEEENQWYNFQISDTNAYKTDLEINIGTNLIQILNSNSDLTCKEEWNKENYIARCMNINKNTE